MLSSKSKATRVHMLISHVGDALEQSEERGIERTRPSAPRQLVREIANEKGADTLRLDTKYALENRLAQDATIPPAMHRGNESIGGPHIPRHGAPLFVPLSLSRSPHINDKKTLIDVCNVSITQTLLRELLCEPLTPKQILTKIPTSTLDSYNYSSYFILHTSCSHLEYLTLALECTQHHTDTRFLWACKSNLNQETMWHPSKNRHQQRRQHKLIYYTN